MQKYLKRPDHSDVKITGGFWKEQLDKIKNTTVWDILNKFEHDHEEGIMKNYEWVAEGKLGKHIGPPWYDGLICEVIRGISDFISDSYDEALDQKIEFYTEKIHEAQSVDKDGYINTYTTLMCPDKRWGENGGSLIWQHELYNMGCLIEAGIHFYRATRKTLLLKCGIAAANLMCSVMGEEPRKNIVPAHSLTEEAVVKLYRLLCDDKTLLENLRNEYGIEIKPLSYLELAKFWMDHRGVHYNRASFPHYMGEYAQDHCKIEDQSEAVGHAVRAALMYTGLAAVGMETEDKKYLDCAKRIFDNVEQTKLHISGGIGAVHNEERFGFQYDLPNDAYLETCAGIALAFLAGEMNLAFGESRYMDVFENALYNNILPCLSVDGTHYFYENPLISDGSLERWSWHGCPCCPPMFLKLMGSLKDYIYAYGEDKIAVNLHMESRANLKIKNKDVVIEQKECGLPYAGKNKVVLHLDGEEEFTVAIRKVVWTDNFQAVIDNQVYTSCDENGYLSITRTWRDGDELVISMDMPPVKIEAHPYVSADVGRVALVRGPLLYCLEEIDNPKGTDVILGDSPISASESKLLGSAMQITGFCSCGEPFTAIPYYLWNNRGRGTMHVWVKQENKDLGVYLNKEGREEYAAHNSGNYEVSLDEERWEGKLYLRYED